MVSYSVSGPRTSTQAIQWVGQGIALFDCALQIFSTLATVVHFILLRSVTSSRGYRVVFPTAELGICHLGGLPTPFPPNCYGVDVHLSNLVRDNWQTETPLNSGTDSCGIPELNNRSEVYMERRTECTVYPIWNHFQSCTSQFIPKQGRQRSSSLSIEGISKSPRKGKQPTADLCLVHGPRFPWLHTFFE